MLQLVHLLRPSMNSFEYQGATEVFRLLDIPKIWHMHVSMFYGNKLRSWRPNRSYIHVFIVRMGSRLLRCSCCSTWSLQMMPTNRYIRHNNAERTKGWVVTWIWTILKSCNLGHNLCHPKPVHDCATTPLNCLWLCDHTAKLLVTQ